MEIWPKNNVVIGNKVLHLRLSGLTLFQWHWLCPAPWVSAEMQPAQESCRSILNTSFQIHFCSVMLSGQNTRPLEATKARNCQKGQADNMNYFKWYVGRALHRCPLGVVSLISHPVVHTQTQTYSVQECGLLEILHIRRQLDCSFSPNINHSAHE